MHKIRTRRKLFVKYCPNVLELMCLHNPRKFNFFNNPISLGSVPVNSLSFMERSLKLVNNPISLKMVPVIKFASIEKVKIIRTIIEILK